MKVPPLQVGLIVHNVQNIARLARQYKLTKSGDYLDQLAAWLNKRIEEYVTNSEKVIKLAGDFDAAVASRDAAVSQANDAAAKAASAQADLDAANADKGALQTALDAANAQVLALQGQTLTAEAQQVLDAKEPG